MGFMGYVQVLSGRVSEGCSALQQGTKDQEASGLALFHSRLTVWLGEAFMRADQLDDARTQAERALTLTRQRGERGLEAWALWLLGVVASRREPLEVETAEGHYRQAIALANDVGLRPLIARCHLGLGELYQRTGRQAEALSSLSTAAAMFTEMGMIY